MPWKTFVQVFSDCLCDKMAYRGLRSKEQLLASGRVRRQCHFDQIQLNAPIRSCGGANQIILLRPTVRALQKGQIKYLHSRSDLFQSFRAPRSPHCLRGGIFKLDTPLSRNHAD
jgi:hypothetical protein